MDRIPDGTRVRVRDEDGDTFTGVATVFDVAPDGTVLYRVIADPGQGAASVVGKHARHHEQLEVLNAV